MEKVEIVQKRIGYSNATLIVNGENSVLVDTGVKGHFKQFQILLNKFGLQPSDLKLIVLTHTHYDHTGNLTDLVKLTGAKVLVHKNEYENLKNGFMPIPTGQRFFTRLVSAIGRMLVPKFASPKPFKADIINENEFDLKQYGLNARVIATPGHSSGSQSVLIDRKLISGDAFLNLPYGTIFPHFADEPALLLKTWQRLYDLGIREIYPGHGTKMKVEKTLPAFEKWKKKLNVKQVEQKLF
jgi:glyoxylase-like metal-dependent hydrolase (beta-lactamase superfamily II)